MGLWAEIVKVWKQEQAERQYQKKMREMEKKYGKTEMPDSMLAEKSAMTAKGEPWVGILKMDIDPNNMADGSFELDWNEIFVARLVKAGYHGKNDKAIVDQWFQNICLGVVSGQFEDEMADPDKRRFIAPKKQIDTTTEEN